MTDRRRWGISRTAILLAQLPLQLGVMFWSYEAGIWALTAFAVAAVGACSYAMMLTVRAAIIG